MKYTKGYYIIQNGDIVFKIVLISNDDIMLHFLKSPIGQFTDFTTTHILNKYKNIKKITEKEVSTYITTGNYIKRTVDTDTGGYIYTPSEGSP